MPFQIEDETLDPDQFLKLAIEAKLEFINRRIESLLSAGQPDELARWSAARAQFLEIQRSPRLYLARTAGTAAPVATRAAAPTPAAAAPAAKPAGKSSFLPLGAIPQPKKYSAGGAEPAATPSAMGGPAPSAKPAAGMMGFLKTVQQSGAPAEPVAPSPKPGGMAGFLKSVQAGAAAPPQESPAATPEPSGKPAGGMVGFLKSIQQPSTAAAPAAESAPEPAPTAPRPSPAPPSGKSGPMLSFLQKMQTGLSPDATKAEEAPSAEQAAANKHSLLETLKQRAAAAGYPDIYAMLRDRKEKFLAKRREIGSMDDPNTAKVRKLIDDEIREIDMLLKEDMKGIERRLEEKKAATAAASAGKTAALQNELGGLLEEIS